MLDDVAGHFLYPSLYLFPTHSSSAQSSHKSYIKIWNAVLKLLIDRLNFLRVSVIKDLFVNRQVWLDRLY